MRQAKEFALDIHLLMRAAYFSVDENIGVDLLDEIAPQHRAAIAPAVVRRLRDALAVEGDNMTTIATRFIRVHDERTGTIDFLAVQRPAGLARRLHPHGPVS